MPISMSCHICGSSFAVPDKFADTAVQCPTCNETLRAPSAPKEDVAEKARPAFTQPKAKKTRPDLFRLRVYDDPAELWSGVYLADLTESGLVLLNASADRNEDVVIPFAVPAEAVAEGYLRVEFEGRVVTFTLMLPGHDHLRLMRDLAEVLRGERQGLRLKDYRVPQAFVLLALAPAIVPVGGLIALQYSTLPQTELTAYVKAHFQIVFWSGLCLCATGLLLFWTRSGSPSIATRMVIGCVFAVTCNCVPLGVFAWRSVDWRKFVPDIDPGPSPQIAEDKWAPFDDPDKKFRIDMPGTPKPSEQLNAGIATSSYMVDLNHAAFIATVFTIPAHEFDRIPLEQRFAGARDGMLKKTPGSRLGSEKDIVFEGSPGKEYVLNMSKYDRMVVRLIAVENHVYMVMAGGRHYTPDTPDVKRYFESLRINGSAIAAATELKGLIGYWSFDDEDAKQAQDSSGNGNHASIEGAVRVAGKRGKGMRFDGKSFLKVQAAKKIEIGPDQKFTIAGWFKFGKEPHGDLVTLRDSAAKDQFISVGLEKAQLRADVSYTDRISGLTRIATVADDRFDSDRWYHFAIVVHGEIDIYINGKRGRYNNGGRKHSAPMSVDEFTFGRDFDGVMDEICIFARDLSQDEIRTLSGKRGGPD